MTAWINGPFAVAVVVALPAIIAAVASLINRRQLTQIHVLVNSKMSEALAKVEQRDARIDQLDARIEQLISDLAAAKAADAEPPIVEPPASLDP